MTSAKDMMTKYEHSPFTLWELRGSEFVILEDLPISGEIREKEEIGEKSGKPYKVYFIQIENGLFHKDLKMFEKELLALFLHTPKGLQNFQGSIFKVDKLNKLGLSYQGTAAQDVNGNPIGAPRAQGPGLMASSPAQAKDQKEAFIETMIGSMESLEGIGVEVTAERLTKICDKISPNNALQMIAEAKAQGMIIESKGIFKVVK